MPDKERIPYMIEPQRIEDRGSLYIKPVESIKIEVGTHITNNSKTWEHVVNKRDKRIILTSKDNATELEVIERIAPESENPKETFIGPTLLDDVGIRGVVPAEAVEDIKQVTQSIKRDPSIVPSGFNITFGGDSCSWIINDQPNLILTDDYGCKIGIGNRIGAHNYYNMGLAPSVYTRSRTRLLKGIAGPESVAIDTLREMITEKEFRKYLKDSFLLVKGKSGLVYQIYRDNSHVKVWEHGKTVEEICVYFKDREIPLTDKVIAFKIMIESDENAFKKLGNVYNMRKAA